MDDAKRLLERAQRLAPTPAFDFDDVSDRRSRHERRRRLSAMIVGLGITAAIVAGAVFATVSNGTHDGAATLGSGGQVESGATYVLSDLRLAPASGSVLVTFHARPSEPGLYPGEAQCEFRLLDAERAVAGTFTATFSLIGSGDSEIHIPIDDDSRPVSASGDCGPGLVPDGSNQYVFANIVAEEDRISADVSGSPGNPHGEFACAVHALASDGSDILAVVDYGGGVGEGKTVVLTSKFEGVGEPEIRCEPFLRLEQFDRGYWLPWQSKPAFG